VNEAKLYIGHLLYIVLILFSWSPRNLQGKFHSVYITRLSIDEPTVAYSCLSKKIGKSSLGKIQVATTRSYQPFDLRFWI